MSRVFKSMSPPTEVKVLPVGGSVPKSSPGHAGREERISAEDQARVHAQTILSDAEEMAQYLLEQAKLETAQLKSEALQEIDQWWTEKQMEWQKTWEEAKGQGFEAGFSEGREAGRLAAEREYQASIQSAKEILEQSYREKEEILSSAEPFLLTLSTEIAKKVIQQEIKTNPDILMGIIESLMLRAKERSSITIGVHPDDYPYVLNRRQQLLALADSQAEVKILPDPSVSPGGCILRTAQGSLDARLDSQLEEIKTALLSLIKDERYD